MPLFQNSQSADSPLVEQTTSSESAISGILADSYFDAILDQFITWSISFGGRLLAVFVIFFIGHFIIKKLLKLEKKLFRKSDMDCALQTFLRHITAIFLYVALIFLIVSIVGTQTISLAAIIASAGLAIGFAVKDNLANFAGGVILLINKPFKGGDLIETQDVKGTVDAVGILYTVLHTFDNRIIHIPNGPLSNGNIINLSAQPTRRLDSVARVAHGTPAHIMRDALLSLVKENDKILLEPEPKVLMTDKSDTFVEFQLRMWVKTEDYREMYFWMNEAIYTELKKWNVGMPFTKMVMQNADKQKVTT